MAVQFHTEGLRQPMLIGKDPAGKKLPGGPYVVWQAAGLLVAPLMWNTTHWWGGAVGSLGQVILIIAATMIVCWALGRLDFAGRNPLWVLEGLVGSLRHAATGIGGLRGRRSTPPTPPRPRRHPAPAAIIGTLPPANGTADDSAPIEATVVMPDMAPASGTTTGPTPPADLPADPPVDPRPNLAASGPVGDPATPVRRLSPLEAFIAAGSANHHPVKGRSNP